MPAVTRQGDLSTGHSSFPPTSASQGSPDVFVNGKPVVRVGDSYTPHGSPTPNPSHSRSLSSGSSTVFINGIPCGRIGDSISCGDASAQGSSNVVAGG